MSISRPFALLPAALFLVAVSGTLLHAQGQAPDPSSLTHLSLEELGNIVVTSVAKAPEQEWNTAAAIYVLTQADIRRSGATSIPELLRLVPGLQVSRIDGDHWAVGVRGLGNQFSQSLLVLIDGRSVYTPLFAGVYWSVQDVILPDVDRIEVIRGPGGTIWGTNAVNGVINIITKPAHDTHGTLVAASGGSVDHAIGTVRVGGAIGDTIDYRLAAQGSQRGAEHHPAYDDFDQWHLAQVTGRLDWTAPGGDSATLDGRAYAGNEGNLVEVGVYNPPHQARVNVPEPVSGGDVRAFWHHVFGPERDVQAQAYYDRTNRHGAELGELRNTMDVDVVAHARLGARNDIRWGGGARISPNTFIQMEPTLDFSPHHQVDHLYSVMAQDEIAIVPHRFAVTAGSKLERNDYTGWEVQPNARAIWTPTMHQSVWTAVSRAVRIPSRIDRDLTITGFLQTPPPAFVRVLGSADFQAERLVAYEAGYRTLLGRRVSLDVSGFHNVYRGLNGLGNFGLITELEPAPAHLVVLAPYANAVDGTTDGVEIAPTVVVTSSWDLKSGYSYLQPHMHTVAGINQPADATTLAGSSPRHQAFLESNVTVRDRFEFSQTVRAVSALPAQSVARYWTADLRAGVRLNPHVEASIVGRNLGSPNHAEFGSSAGPVGISPSVLARVVWTTTP